MDKKFVFVLVVFMLTVCLFSCTKDKTTVAPPLNCSGINTSTNIYNASDPSANISNILNLNCAYAPCHGGGSQQEGVNFADYATTVASFKSVDVICALTGTNGCIRMPNNQPPLPDSTILQIECWQAAGYPGQ